MATTAFHSVVDVFWKKTALPPLQSYGQALEQECRFLGVLCKIVIVIIITNVLIRVALFRQQATLGDTR